MTLDLLGELAWKSAVAAGATLAMLRLLAERSAAEKSAVAALGLLALLMLPVAILGLPRVELALPAKMSAAFPPPADTIPAAVAGPILPPGSAAGFDWAFLITALYAIPASLLLIVLMTGVIRIQRVRARADVLHDARWLTALAAAQGRMGMKHGTALLTSSEINSPVSWGVIRPTIIVDPAALAAVDRAEAIVTHELAHVARLDWLKLLAGRLAVALFWFNPLVWMLARRSHHLSEEAADDAVLRGSVDRADYADLLVSSVRHANNPLLFAANGVAPGRSSISRRVGHVLDAGRPRAPAGLSWLAASLLAAAGLNAMLAAAEPVLARPVQQLIGAGAGARAAAELDRLDSTHARRIAAAMRAADWSARRVDGNTLFDEPRAAAPLTAALGDPDPAVRRIALWGLSELRPAPAETGGAVARLLADPTPEVRAEAARALGDFAAVDRADAVAALLHDPDTRVRAAAVHALGDLQHPGTRAALQAALNDPEEAVRAKARWALAQVADTERIIGRYGRR